MSKARLVITAVTVERRPVAQVARDYGVARSWIYELLARYRLEGEAAFEPRSRAPKSNPRATPDAVVQQVLTLRKRLAEHGLDAGADTIAWHLGHHGIRLSRATIHRILSREGAVTPEPKKRPRSSYIRFEANQPNETWQSDFTHYRLTRPDGTAGTAVEIITWLDDHSRYALHVTAHRAITSKIVLDTFRHAGDLHGYPASTLTDNGLVYTVRLASPSRRGGRTALEKELRRRNIVQKNGKPSHPTTQGKVERFQATMKKWLTAQPVQPTIEPIRPEGRVKKSDREIMEILEAFDATQNANSAAEGSVWQRGWLAGGQISSTASDSRWDHAEHATAPGVDALYSTSAIAERSILRRPQCRTRTAPRSARRVVSARQRARLLAGEVVQQPNLTHADLRRDVAERPAAVQRRREDLERGVHDGLWSACSWSTARATPLRRCVPRRPWLVSYHRIWASLVQDDGADSLRPTLLLLRVCHSIEHRATIRAIRDTATAA
jgi:transposase